MNQTTITRPDHRGELIRESLTYYGVHVVPIGEENDVVILGHHADRLVVAALNAYVRKFIGEDNLQTLIGDDFPYSARDLIDEVSTGWAVFALGCEEHDPASDPDCSSCRDITHEVWWIRWGQSEGTPGAFPVMVWSPPS